MRVILPWQNYVSIYKIYSTFLSNQYIQIKSPAEYIVTVSFSKLTSFASNFDKLIIEVWFYVEFVESFTRLKYQSRILFESQRPPGSIPHLVYKQNTFYHCICTE